MLDTREENVMDLAIYDEQNDVEYLVRANVDIDERCLYDPRTDRDEFCGREIQVIDILSVEPGVDIDEVQAVATRVYEGVDPEQLIRWDR